MTTPSTPSFPRLFVTISLLLTAFSFALADSPIIRMARISLIDGEVSYRRANDDNNWYDAANNTPLGENDQVYTGRQSRAEIQLTGRNIVRLDAESSFKVSQFTTAVTQISLPLGTAIFRIDSLDRRQFDLVDANDSLRNEQLYFEVNTPTVAITLHKTGTYRITVQEDGTTEIVVRSGEAEVFNQEIGTLTLKKNHRMTVEGKDVAFYQITRPQDKDGFDLWSERRDNELSYQADSLSARYVPHGVPGVYDLDRYGDWSYTSDYGYVWSPRTVAVGWSPYSVGSWRWYSDWGWTWISTEPWGWTPYHYGRWSYYRNRWCWVPRDSFSVGYSWSPALVTWFGWGNGGNYNRGYNNGYRDGYYNGRYDQVGWVALAPGERYHNPFRGSGGNTTIVNNTNIYGNGNTVINTNRLDSFRNANAPGGVRRMDGRRFDSSRVAVNNLDNAPIQKPVLSSAITARGDSLRPAITPHAQPQVNSAANPSGRQNIERSVISRGAIRSGESFTPNPNATPNVVNGNPTLRSSDVARPVDRTIRPDRTTQDNNNTTRDRVYSSPDASRVTNRAGNTDNRVYSPSDSSRVTNRSGNVDSGNSNREYQRTDRPTDRITERSVDRPVYQPRQPENNSNNTDRTIRPERPNYNQENRRENPPPDYSNRRVETERRDTPSRQVERPSPPPRQEAPPRETRSYERQAPPPSAPPRETRSYERQSPPPAPAPSRVESAPSRGSDRTERPARENSGGRRGQ